MGDKYLDLDEPGAGKTEDGSGKDGGKKEDGKELILGRFKDTDELAKSYKESEAKMTQALQEAAELKKLVLQLQEQQGAKAAPVEEPVDLDTLFWNKPSAMLDELKKEVGKLLEPLAANQLQSQKAQLRSDPDFVKYEAEIDQLVGQMPPQLKNQPGLLGELFTLVKGRHQNEILEDAKKRIREEIEAEREGKIYGSLEEPSGGHTFTGKDGLPRLTEDEKRVAEHFNPELSKAEAHKKYAEKKARLDKEDRIRMGGNL